MEDSPEAIRLLVRSTEDMPRNARALHVLERFATRHVVFASIFVQVSKKISAKTQQTGQDEERERGSMIRPNSMSVAQMRGNRRPIKRGAGL